jgi:hypothetical protein
MELGEMEITQTQIRTGTPADSPLVGALARTFAGIFARTSTLVATRLGVLWRSGIWRSLHCRTWVRRVGSRRKTLSVRETAALGDRRFVSVIQFERQRFLIGSSPSSITLLAQLPDESASGEATRDSDGKESPKKN